MANAYSLNLTTGALTLNGTVVANLLDVEVGINFESVPGILENAVPGTLTVGFSLKARIHDVASDARILAQGPAGLLPSIAGIAGKQSVYYFFSQAGDTLAMTNVPGTITQTLASPALADVQP